MLAAGAAHAAPAAAAQSANWAGYAAVRPHDATFTHAIGVWTVPALDCSAGRSTSSMTWVGLGGFRRSAPALEQLGTEGDCEGGDAEYSAWLEVVPAPAETVDLPVAPGDRIVAGVRVTGHRVRFRLRNATQDVVAERHVWAPVVDRSSAEWIVEAPSLCAELADPGAGGCRQAELSNFGTTWFLDGWATAAGGHRGQIRDRAWRAVPIALVPEGGGPGGPERVADAEAAGGGSAAPGPLTGPGRFAVSYAGG